MSVNCRYRTTSEFYLGEEEGSQCLDVCKLMSEDDDHIIYLESAIVSDDFCEKCKNRTPHYKSRR